MQRISVSDIAKQIRGVSYKPADLHDELDENSVVLLRANNICNGEINFDDVVYVDKRKVSKEQYLQIGDILVCASSGSKNLVGKSASVLFDKPCTFGAFCKVVRPDRKYSKYLGMYFQSEIYRRKISEVALGANINNIRNEHIDSLMLPIYSDTDNSKIVNRLQSVRQIITHLRTQLEKLDLLVKDRFVEMFGDPQKNTQNRPTTELINVVRMQRGFDLPTYMRNQNGDIPVYGANGALAKHDTAKVFGGGIITGRSGTIGNVYYTLGDYWPLNTSLFSAELNGNNIVYLAYLLKLFDLTRFKEGTGVPTLNRNKFHKELIINVPLEEQTQFADFVKQIDKSRFVT